MTAFLAGQERCVLVEFVHRDGELCDRWGTPFFFHAESAARMEIRSAGPDRRLWTEDDVVFTP